MALVVGGTVVLVVVLLLAGDGQVRAIEGAAVEHERGLGGGGLLEVDDRRFGVSVEVDVRDLSTEPTCDISARFFCLSDELYVREEVM